MVYSLKLISSLYEKLLDFRLGALLLLCVFIGGNSGYSIGLKYILYLFSVFAIASCLSSKFRNWRNFLNFPSVLGLVLFGLCVLYLIPLPPGLTADLPFRDYVAKGYALSGFAQPSLPLSLTPETSYISLYDFIPPFAIAILVLLTSREKEIGLAARVLIVAISISAILGLFQLLFSSTALYFQSTPSAGTGLPSGFFANPNHFATTLVFVLLFAGHHLLRGVNTGKYDQFPAAIPVLASIAIALLLLTFTKCSSAILILGITLVPMLLILARTTKHRLTIIGLSVFGGALYLFDYFILGQNFLSLEQQLVGTNRLRLDVWSTVVGYPSFPSLFGTGPGSFYETYLIMSSSSDFTGIYVNEAHNDFLQIVMELGLIGGGLVAAYLIWFGRQFFSTLTQKGNFRNEKLLLLFSLLVPILHSVTDYPLRTPAIMAIFVFFTMVLVRFNQLEAEQG